MIPAFVGGISDTFNGASIHLPAKLTKIDQMEAELHKSVAGSRTMTKKSNEIYKYDNNQYQGMSALRIQVTVTNIDAVRTYVELVDVYALLLGRPEVLTRLTETLDFD